MLWLLLVAVSWAVPTVAITDLANHTGDPAFDGAGPGVAGILMARFSETDAVRVVERDALVALLDEQRLTLAGLTEPETAARAGRLLGAEYLVVGELFSVKLPSIAVALRVVDTETGEVIASREVTGEVGARGERFFALVDEISDAILEALDVSIDSGERARLSEIERREWDAVLRYGEDLTRVNTDHPMSLYRQSDLDFSRDRFTRTHWMVYERDGAEVAMPLFARRVGDDDTNMEYMYDLRRLRRRAVRETLLVLGYGLVGIGLVVGTGSVGDRDGDPQTPTALQYVGFGLATLSPLHLIVNVFIHLARRMETRWVGRYYAPEDADRWIHTYNRSLR